MGLELLRGRVTGPVALLIVAVLFFLGALYAAGIITTLGYEQRRVTFSGFASGTSAGGGFGLKDMLFFEGQTFYADYDIEVREGSFRIAVHSYSASMRDSSYFEELIETSGSGELTYEIPETGLYWIIFEGDVRGGRKGKGYDVSYSVEWGAR